MHTRKRLVWFLALTTVVAFSAACGGAAEEPAEAPAPVEEPEPVAEPAPVEPEPEPEPQQQQVTLVGDIVEVGEGEMDWLRAASRDEPGRYYWQVQLRNDTTATLDLTVTWEFLDENEEVVKSDNTTVRVAPAETGTFRLEGDMVRDDYWRVAGYTYSWDWAIVESN